MRYNPKMIESKWQKKWLREKIYEPDFLRAKKPFYNLMMFPYPSAEGLHVGNMYAFCGADIYGRFMRMRGYDVFEPIGLDGFGIHSENYALKIGKHPVDQAKISEKNFYRQLGMIGNGFAWRERLETYDPEYYRWTQWIFIQMFKRGLAYRKKAEVNWCPSCKTVLADEQVLQKSQITNNKFQKDPNSKRQATSDKRQESNMGVCERCDTSVIRKELEQWFFKITEYAEPLLKNLEKIDWSEKVKIAQRNWIGKSEGALIKFQITNNTFQTNSKPQIQNSKQFLEVFTTRPDTLFGATYMVVGPEHPLVTNNQLEITNYQEVEEYIKKAGAKTEEERMAEGREKTGVEIKGIKAINPANNEEMPIWVADYVLGHVGTGAIMAVPAHDQRDMEFARKFRLSMIEVIDPVSADSQTQNSKLKTQNHKEKLKMEKAYEGEGVLINSRQFNGMPSEKAKSEITQFVAGKRMTRYKLRDWLISRQRYWGPPIPMIYCKQCADSESGERKEMPGWFVVSEKDLPIRLPRIKNFRPTGTDKSPLASVETFYKVRCPKCGSWARRETDVSDTFLDSAWYYLGYIILGNQKSKIKNQKFQIEKKMIQKWLPVDMYIGGAEHSVLHLLYVRFLAMALRDMGFLGFEEPFPTFRAHGLLIKDGAKMSKSRGNVVNPDEYIRAYGVDALRMYLMFLGPFEQGGDFRDSGIKGITRFLERAWRFVNSKLKTQNSKPQRKTQNEKIERIVHKTVKKVTEDIQGLQYNTAISALMILLNMFEECPEAVSKKDVKIFLKLLAPFAPHITEGLWQQLAKSLKIKTQNSTLQRKTQNEKKIFYSIHQEIWPQCNPRFIVEDTFELVVQVNGKVRGKIGLAMGASEEEAKKAALALASVKPHISGEPRKTIFLPNRLINFVLKKGN